MYAEDRSLIGKHNYIVTGRLKNYPTIVFKEETEEITIIDICLTPFSLDNDQATFTGETDYSTRVTFDGPAFTVEPSVCNSEAIYTCEFVSADSDYDGDEDLCGTVS